MKARAPVEYWQQQVEKLVAAQPALYAEVRDVTFAKWDASSIGYNRQLAKKLAEVIGNEHRYAESTLLRKCKDAAIQRERDLRRRGP